jgi:hypothetical protein
MSFDSIGARADGTLRNPVVVGVVLIWALVLLAVCLASLKSGSRFRGVTVVAVLLFGWLLSPFVVITFVNGIYRITSSPSVGFLGRPPAWAASLIAAAGVLVALLARRKAFKRVA